MYGRWTENVVLWRNFLGFICEIFKLKQFYSKLVGCLETDEKIKINSYHQK